MPSRHPASPGRGTGPAVRSINRGPRPIGVQPDHGQSRWFARQTLTGTDEPQQAPHAAGVVGSFDPGYRSLGMREWGAGWITSVEGDLHGAHGGYLIEVRVRTGSRPPCPG